MVRRIGLALVLMAMLAGCNTLHCGEQSDGSRASGGCGMQSTF